MLDRRSLLVAGASSLASIMLPRVPGSANAFILPFAPTEAYADEKDPFRVLVLSRTMFGVVVVDVANKNIPSREPRSRSRRVMPRASSSPPLPTTRARPSLRSRLFRKATWTRQRFSTRTTLTAASPLAWQATAMSRFPLRVSRAAPLLPHPHVRSPMASRTFDSSRSTNGTSSTPTPRLWQCQRTKQQTTSPTRTLLPCRLICRRAGRQRCISIK